MNAFRCCVASAPLSIRCARGQCYERVASLKEGGALTEGHHREEVMDDMEVGDVVQEESTLPSEEVAIDGRSSTPLEVPLAIAIVGKLHVGMVEVRDHDEPAKRKRR